MCSRYTDERRVMVNAVQSLTEVSLRVLLYGDDNLTEEQNLVLFEAVHRYIHATKRLE